MFGELHKLRISSLSSSVDRPVTSSVLRLRSSFQTQSVFFQMRDGISNLCKTGKVISEISGPHGCGSHLQVKLYLCVL
jgi:hypothetical protein